jgi:hypothetical protein
LEGVAGLRDEVMRGVVITSSNILTEGLQGLGSEYLDTMAASISLKRLGSVDDIGNAAALFASKVTTTACTHDQRC